MPRVQRGKASATFEAREARIKGYSPLIIPKQMGSIQKIQVAALKDFFVFRRFGNPLSHCFAMPAPPRGGSFISGYGKASAFSVKYGLTDRCIKAPPSGELAPKVPERVQQQQNAVCRNDPTRENVFGAARRLQQRRLPPAADTGRSCWGSGQQDASECEADAGSRKSRTNTKIKMDFPL